MPQVLTDCIVKYNPVSILLQKILNKTPFISDLLNYFSSILFNQTPNNVKNLLFLLGISAITVKSVLKIINFIQTWKWIIIHLRNQRNFNINQMRNRYGNCWVLITGFTGGIGWGFAQYFAKLGYNLILLGRNPDKIAKRTQYLAKYFPNIKFQVINVDFTHNEQVKKMQSQLKQLLKKIDLGIVVNNVAVAQGAQFQKTKLEGLLNTANINARINKYMTELVLPTLRSRQNRSALINISSCTGIYSGPFVGIYGMTKRFFNIYNLHIAQQNKDKIDVISPTPFGVTTQMMKMRKGPMMITPKQCVKSIICDLMGGERHTFGHFKHKISGSIFYNKNQKGVFDMYAFFRKKKDS